MADLMTGVYSYDALVKKYGNFCVPLIRIKKGRVDLVSVLKLSVLELKVTLSLEAASMAVFKIGGIYDEETHSFEDKVKSGFTLGNIMEVELGYQSSALSIFKGYVAMLGAEFGKTPCLVVTLMDVRRLMMQSGSVYMLHHVSNYSDAFRTTMSKYAKLCTVSVDATSDNLENPLSQTQNDYLFVTGELIRNGKADREFFVLGGKAYFREPAKMKIPIMTLQFGRELLALKNDEEYQDLKIEVIGFDEGGQKAVTGKASVQRGSNSKKILTATPVLTVTDPTVDTQKKANEKANSIARKKEWTARSGTGVTIGLPELVPGRFVRVRSLEKDYGDHEYYIKNVVHEISGEVFQTVFEIGGWN